MKQILYDMGPLTLVRWPLQRALKVEIFDLACLKLTKQQMFNQGEDNYQMYYDSYLFKMKYDLDFHFIDSVFCFMLRVFKLGTEYAI